MQTLKFSRIQCPPIKRSKGHFEEAGSIGLIALPGLIGFKLCFLFGLRESPFMSGVFYKEICSR